MDVTEPLALAAAYLARQSGSFAWLDAGPSASSGASYLVLPAAREERIIANVRAGSLRETGASPGASRSDIFSRLRERWSPAIETGSQAQFAGGWVGWFGYECAAATLGLDLPTEGPDYPDAAWFAAGAWATLDHASGAITIAGTDDDALQRLRTAVETEPFPGAQRASARVVASWRDSEAHYADQVRAAQRFIAEGEAYQLCLTSRVAGSEPVDALELYLALRAAAPSHHGSLIRIEDTTLVSVSPEQFLEATPSGRLRTKPIKGTRKRASDADEDAALAAELAASDKERAENVMIVDLMRNDLARVAVTGSVTVPALLAVETYAPVHQLVSTIEAQLEPGRHPIDAIVATFPAGSMTGAPKHRAVQRLTALESGPRGIYSGAHGYLSNDGSIDLAMTIRSIVVRPDGWSIGAGGGITALSVPADEVAEAHLKAAALLRALRAESAD